MTHRSGAEHVAKADLAIPDYDHLPVGSLATRVRSLDAVQLAQIITYEELHGARTPVLQVLRTRRDQLAAGEEPTGGDPAGPAPESLEQASTGSPVSPTTAKEPEEPARHGLARPTG